MAGKLTDLDAAALVREALSYVHPGQTVVASTSTGGEHVGVDTTTVVSYR